MARVTVEDCIAIVPNQFELIVLSAQLAREVNVGAHDESVRAMHEAKKSRYKEKPPVLALRKIAAHEASIDHLRDAVITGMQPSPFLEIKRDAEAVFADNDSTTAAAAFDSDTPQPNVGPVASLSGTDEMKMFEDIEVDD